MLTESYKRDKVEIKVNVTWGFEIFRETKEIIDRLLKVGTFLE